jgi:hypothetical protein
LLQAIKRGRVTLYDPNTATVLYDGGDPGTAAVLIHPPESARSHIPAISDRALLFIRGWQVNSAGVGLLYVGNKVNMPAGASTDGFNVIYADGVGAGNSDFDSSEFTLDTDSSGGVTLRRAGAALTGVQVFVRGYEEP